LLQIKIIKKMLIGISSLVIDHHIKNFFTNSWNKKTKDMKKLKVVVKLLGIFSKINSKFLDYII